MSVTRENGEKLPTSVACQRAGMNRERLLRRVQAGEIDAVQVAGRYLIDADSLTAFLRRSQPEPAPAA